MYAQAEEYVDTFEDTMNAKFIITNRALTLTLQDQARNTSVRYDPNTLNYLGFGGYFWGLGFQFNFPLPIPWFFDDDLSEDSRIFDFQGTLFKNKWVMDNIFQSYRDLYLRDGPDESVDRFDMRRILVTITHVFNGEQMSFKSAFNLNRRQKRSAGSFLLTAGFSSLELEGENLLRPFPNVQDDEVLSAVRGVSMLVRPGYAHHFVHKNFFLHTSAGAGMALQYKLITQNEDIKQNWGLAPTLNLRGSLGYDNGRYFAALYTVYYRSRLDTDRYRLQENSRDVKLILGYRFAEPRWLRERKPAILGKFQ